MVFGLQTQPKSWLTGYTFWVNHYLEIPLNENMLTFSPFGPSSSQKGASALITFIQDPSPTTPITPGPKSIKIQRRLTMILKDKDNENLTEAEKASLLKKVCNQIL